MIFPLFAPTTRGGTFIAAALALGFCAALFQDVFVLTAFLVVIAVLIEEVIWLRIISGNAPKWFLLTRESPGLEDKRRENVLRISRIAYPGNLTSDEFYLRKLVSSGSARIFSSIDYLSLSPDQIKSGEEEVKIRIEFKTPFSGKYETNKMALNVESPFVLFHAICEIPALIEFKVIPRVLEVAIESTKLISKAGIGETPVERPGIGTEFYELREYATSDDYRAINWKATARKGKLFVNDRMKEVAASYYLVLDANAPDYFDRDRLAATFLQLANSLFKLGTKFGMVVHDEEHVTTLKRLDTPQNSLYSALILALEFANVVKEDMPEKLMAIPAGRLRTNQQLLQEIGFDTLSEIEESGFVNMKDTVQNSSGPYGTILKLLNEEVAESETPAVLYITGLFHSVGQVVELGTEIRTLYNSEFIVANPAAQWVTASSEADAYASYKAWERNLRILNNAGIQYRVGEPASIAQNAF